MIYSVHFVDGDREFDCFSWELGLEWAVSVAPLFMALCGATSGFILNERHEEVWAHAV
jgi:hypothetical protein